MSRCSWDDHYMELAYLTAEMSTCNADKVGAVLTLNNEVLTTGFNGSPSKTRHCTDTRWCVDSVSCHDSKMPSRAIHAEANAVGQAAKRGIATDGATCYCTTEPCIACLKQLISAGVKRIIYDKVTNSNIAVKLAILPNDVEFRQYTKSE